VSKLLEVRNLSVLYEGEHGDAIEAVSNVSFALEKGEMVGIIGESGSGKTTVIQAILGLLGPAGRVVQGEIMLRGVELLNCSRRTLEKTRWKIISVVPQNTMNALNPVMTVGKQIEEAILLHEQVSRREARCRAGDLLERVQIPRERMAAYPHELSGGMKQRVGIAMALACRPQIMILDEATTGLDVLTQASIMSLIKELQQAMRLSILMVSHDLPLVDAVCDRTLMMSAGKMLEQSSEQTEFALNRYSFHRYATVDSHKHISLNDALNDQIVGSKEPSSTKVEVSGLNKVISQQEGLFKRRLKTQSILKDIQFAIPKGTALGLVGESGSGKTTLARLLMRLGKETSGEIRVDGVDICPLNDAEFHPFRSKMQMIFQDPYDSLNPALSVLELLTEPFEAQRIRDRSTEEQLSIIKDVLEQLELTPSERYLGRFPYELSGGQRQRVALARALVLNPSFIAADEPTSMLDVSVRGEILHLLRAMQQKNELTMLYITHDLASAAYVCDTIAILYRGCIVEMGPMRRVVTEPRHPYTKALVGVVSNLRKFLMNSGDFIVSNPHQLEETSSAAGCVFSSRCPIRTESCSIEEPPWVVLEEDHRVRCYEA